MSRYVEDITDIYGDNMFRLEGLDDCIVGHTVDGVFIYSINKILQHLMDSAGMSYEDALEFFDYNLLESAAYFFWERD